SYLEVVRSVVRRFGGVAVGFFFSSRRRHTRFSRDWSSDVCSSDLCSHPPKLLNVTGPETISIRWVAEEFGRRMGRSPQFSHEEGSTSLLNNAALAQQMFGYPSVSLTQMIDWTAGWVENDGANLGKPTHFQVR